MNILAIESSCDETACAIIRDGTEILSNVIASSTAMHEKWGGIVPEVAAREQLASIIPIITEAIYSCHAGPDPASKKYNELDSGSKAGMTHVKNIIETNIDAIAVTVGPGLIGSLLIGVETAKAISFITGKPIIPVNHVLAHMYANFLETSQVKPSTERYLEDSRNNHLTNLQTSNLEPLTFPAISLVVSGGHTELFLMTNPKKLKWLGGTLDDAAGEAFDKTARLLGFGHGGGLAIQEAAGKYELGITNKESRMHLPRPMMHDHSLNFSFSGLKTAILREVNALKEKQELTEKTISYLAYEVQEAITDVLVTKTIQAAKKYHASSILISGGVASNTRLREKMEKDISSQSSAIRFHCPPVSLCTDNAAYIGSYAFFRGEPVDWHDITAIPDLTVEE